MGSPTQPLQKSKETKKIERMKSILLTGLAAYLFLSVGSASADQASCRNAAMRLFSGFDGLDAQQPVEEGKKFFEAGGPLGKVSAGCDFSSPLIIGDVGGLLAVNEDKPLRAVEEQLAAVGAKFTGDTGKAVVASIRRCLTNAKSDKFRASKTLTSKSRVECTSQDGVAPFITIKVRQPGDVED